MKQNNDLLNIFGFSVGICALVLGVRYFAANKNGSVVFKYDVSNTVASISTAEAKRYAERLYNAMKDIGTIQSEITDVYNEIKNFGVGSLALIYNEFGVRKYGFFGSPTTPFFSSDKDLREWLRAEVTNENFIYWDALFNSINGK